MPQISFYDDVWLNQISYKKSLNDDGETNTQFINRLKKVIHKIITRDLTPRQEEIVTLYYFDRLNMPQIAALKSLNKSTVSRHLKVAQKRIKQLLKYSFEMNA
ncbi:MAG: hypothetical protein LBB04_01985 [Oscillospiraceae bacterium]|jgi:RNA polymerase sigma factor (sigma-70 family)|nr:hypothetical protein [Oscillospiraceae bacterium]